MPDIICIRSQRCWVDGSLQEATILIQGNKILDIRKGTICTDNFKLFDFGTAVVMPGVIDPHVHINEPGRTSWEGFETATKAATKGGITTLIDMPLNSSPVVTNTAAFKAKLDACRNKLYANCGFWAGAIDASVNEVTALLEEGCFGVKVFLSHSGIDEFPNISLQDLELLMSGIRHLDVPVLAHCELDTLPADNSLQHTPHSYMAYLKSRPKQWENEAIKKFINLSQQYNCKTHIVHLASDEIVQWLHNKKDAGLPFTVETCPHYLLFSAEKIEDGNTLYKCAPPIREKQNSTSLKTALKNGIIDFLSSDHSPAPPDLKELESGDFSRAWGGIAGLQFLLSASWTALKDVLSLEEFIPLVTIKPAQFLGLQNCIGTLAKGYNADITVWQPEDSFVVDEHSIEHRHKATPYLHWTLFGRVNTTFVNGSVAYDGQSISDTPYGHTIKRNAKIGHN